MSEMRLMCLIVSAQTSSLEIKHQLISLHFPAPMLPFLCFLYILQKKKRGRGKKEFEAPAPLFYGEIPVLKNRRE